MMRCFPSRQSLPRQLARLAVQREHFFYGRRMRLRGGLEYLLYCSRNPGKWNDPIEERLDGNFVGRIEGNGVGSSFPAASYARRRQGNRCRSGGSKCKSASDAMSKRRSEGTRSG